MNLENKSKNSTIIFFKFLKKAIFRPTPADNFSSFRSILRLPIIFDLCSLILQIKDFLRLKHIRKNYLTDDPYFREVHDYNASVTLKNFITTSRRAEKFYEVLTVSLENIGDKKILLVGPRNIQELFFAWTYGFKWKNIDGIDLYSTNPKILPMNMEKQTFPNEKYDCVVMAHTLAYANDVGAVVNEISRILVPGGRFVFNNTFCPSSTDYPGNLVSSVKIVDMLLCSNMEIYYQSGAYKINALGMQQNSRLLGTQKRSDKNKLFDPLRLIADQASTH